MVDIRRAMRLGPKRGFLSRLSGSVNKPKPLLQGRPGDVRGEARYVWDAGVEITGRKRAVPLSTPAASQTAITSRPGLAERGSKTH